MPIQEGTALCFQGHWNVIVGIFKTHDIVCSGAKLFIKHCKGFSGQSPVIRSIFSPRPSLSSSLTVFLWLPGRQLAHTAQLWVSLLRYLFTGLEHLMWGQTAVMITDFCSSPLQMGPDAKLLTGQRRCHLSCSRWQTLISDGLASL